MCSSQAPNLPIPCPVPNQSILKEISPGCSLEGLMLKLKLQYFGHLMRRVDSLEKTLMLGEIWGQKEKGMIEDEMAGWHPWLDGHEFEKTPGVGDGQGGLACCDSWGRKELDTTEQLNWTALSPSFGMFRLSKAMNLSWGQVCEQISLPWLNETSVSSDTKEHKLSSSEMDR